jgi:hypothetical protein
MASSRRSPLTRLQSELLDALFAREQGFYLTGGAALSGFFLHHRPTDDLDLFTGDRATFERGRFVLREAAESAGARLEIRQESPGFLRGVLTRGDEGVVVDLVLEPVAQRVAVKPVIDGVRIDPPEEIVANKLAAIASRAEIRDLVDLWFLERHGLSIEGALDAALAKDGGATPAAIAWALSQVQVDAAARLPGDVEVGELARFREDLMRRLRKAAFPR